MNKVHKVKSYQKVLAVKYIKECKSLRDLAMIKPFCVAVTKDSFDGDVHRACKWSVVHEYYQKMDELTDEL